MCGIFAYLNHLTPKTRREILDILISGLKRLEYRGYDSAGVGVDGSSADQESYNIYLQMGLRRHVDIYQCLLTLGFMAKHKKGPSKSMISRALS